MDELRTTLTHELYILVYSATRPRDDFSIEIGKGGTCEIHASHDAAVGAAFRYGKADFPPSDGWMNHDALAGVLSRVIQSNGHTATITIKEAVNE